MNLPKICHSHKEHAMKLKQIVFFMKFYRNLYEPSKNLP